MTTTGRLVNKVSLARGVSGRSPITPGDCGRPRWGGGEPWSRDRSRGSRDRGRTAGPAAPQAAGSFHRKSTRGVHPHVSEFPENYCIGLSYARKTSVQVKDLYDHRLQSYGLRHFSMITLQTLS